MTRKQVLELAAQALAENEEAVQVLHTMIDELPLNRWTEDAIRDSVEQFILDNGRTPLRTDFKKKCLPPHSVIKRRFGVTLQEWLDQNYPTEKTPLDELHALRVPEELSLLFRDPEASAEVAGVVVGHLGGLAVALVGHAAQVVEQLAEVHGLLGQRDALQHVRRDAQLAQDEVCQRGHIPGKGQGEVV